MGLIKAILFDLDGTLIDSEPFHYSSWNDLLNPYGYSLELDDYLKTYSGVSLSTNAERLRAIYKIDTPIESLVSEREAIYRRKLSSDGVRLMPFVLETLEFFEDQGIAMGLVTSSSRREVDIILEKTGFLRFFKITITGGEVVNLKPHPEPYDKAALAMGFKKSEYLAFEDTLTGFTSAKSAGLGCFAIQSQKEHLGKISTVTDHIFPSMEEARRYLVDNKFMHDAGASNQ